MSNIVESEGSEECTINLVMEEVLDKAENYYQFEKNIQKVGLEEVRNLARSSKFSYSVLSP